MTNRLCYVCEGGDCTEKGSGDLFDKLRDLVKEFDPSEERIKIRRYPCFGACEQGINVTLYPDRVFYSEVTDADLAEMRTVLVSERIQPVGPAPDAHRRRSVATSKVAIMRHRPEG